MAHRLSESIRSVQRNSYSGSLRPMQFKSERSVAPIELHRCLRWKACSLYAARLSLAPCNDPVVSRSKVDLCRLLAEDCLAHPLTTPMRQTRRQGVPLPPNVLSQPLTVRRGARRQRRADRIPRNEQLMTSSILGCREYLSRSPVESSSRGSCVSHIATPSLSTQPNSNPSVRMNTSRQAQSHQTHVTPGTVNQPVYSYLALAYLRAAASVS